MIKTDVIVTCDGCLNEVRRTEKEAVCPNGWRRFDLRQGDGRSSWIDLCKKCLGDDGAIGRTVKKALLTERAARVDEKAAAGRSGVKR